MSDGVKIVPANEASFEDLQAVELGPWPKSAIVSPSMELDPIESR